MHEPRNVHWTGVLRVLSYVKGAPGKGLVYERMVTQGSWFIQTQDMQEIVGTENPHLASVLM